VRVTVKFSVFVPPVPSVIDTLLTDTVGSVAAAAGARLAIGVNGNISAVANRATARATKDRCFRVMRTSPVASECHSA